MWSVLAQVIPIIVSESQCSTFTIDSRLPTCPNCSQLFRNLESFLLYCALDVVRTHSVEVSPRRLLISTMTAHFSFDFFPVRILWAKTPDALMMVVYQWVLCSTELQLEDNISILAFMISFEVSCLQWVPRLYFLYKGYLKTWLQKPIVVFCDPEWDFVMM